MLFTEIARTWVIQRDSVNTAIIPSYSTILRNARIHGLSEITGIYNVVGQVGFVQVSGIRRQKTELVGSEELKPIPKEPMLVVRNHPVLYTALTEPILCYAHLLLKGPQTVRRKTLGYSIYDIISYGYFL